MICQDITGSAAIAGLASRALRDELAAYPKPGLVSHVDNGSHPDMDAGCFLASIEALEPFFEQLAAAGAEGCPLLGLQEIGIAAEEAMMTATAGRNTHRGAIFSLGLLAAAAGRRARTNAGLRDIILSEWAGDLPAGLRGTAGARWEAKQGFPSVFQIGLPALRRAGADSPGACIQVFYELLCECGDTTLLKRGGEEGMRFARREAVGFLEAGGIHCDGWMAEAERIHRAFISRNLTAGGVADLLAATLFVHSLEEGE